MHILLSGVSIFRCNFLSSFMYRIMPAAILPELLLTTFRDMLYNT